MNDRPTQTPFRTPVQPRFSRIAPDAPLQNLGEKLAGLKLPVAASTTNAPRSVTTPNFNRRPRQ